MFHKSRVTMIAFVLALLIISAITNFGRVRADIVPGKPDRRPDSDSIPAKIMLANPNAAAEKADSTETTTSEPWFFLVFQQFVDDNWEIYLQTGPNGPYNRLTWYSAYDLDPSLNFSASQIVWVSKLPGNYDLYTMNVDGSNFKRILATPYDESSPSWSQNGQWIAFDAKINEHYDLFTINPDGAGLSNLTQTPTIDEFYPNWSPDNQKIVFVRNDGSGSRIYVMDSNGANLHPITGYLNYLGKPMWSPDGAWIGFDADLDGDGWNELGKVKPDGSNLAEFFDYNTYYYDAWMNGWWSDSQSVVMTRVQYYESGGYLYYFKLDTGRVDMSGSVYSYYQDNGVSASPYFQTNDHAAPKISLDSLPAFCHSERFNLLCYRQSDPGTAPITLAIVQRRLYPNGAWEDYYQDYQQGYNLYKCFSLTGTPGNTYAYRGKSIDLVGNTSLWSVQEPQTTFYSPEVSGEVLDNRNSPVAGVPISLSPPTLNTVNSGAASRYFAFLPGDGSYSFSQVDVPGYSSILSKAINFTTDVQLDIPLSPTDNQILNGNFESNNGSLTNWSTSNVGLPVEVAPTDRPTGSSSAGLGFDCITDPCLGEQEPLPFYFPGSALVIDSNDTLHMLAGSTGLQYFYKPAGGSWSAFESIPFPEPYPNSLGPSLVIAPDGTLYASGSYYSSSNEDIFLSQRPPGGSWQTAIKRSGYSPAMGVDSHGTLHLLYSQEYSTYYQQCTTVDNCQPPILLFTNPINDHAIAIGPDDRVHVLIANGSTLFYKVRQTNGSWVDESVPQVGRRSPQIVASPDGTITIYGIWLGNGKTAYLPPGGQWSQITEHPEFRDAGVMYADRFNKIHMAGGSSATNTSYYKNYHPDSGWSEAEPINGWYYSSFALGVDSTDKTHMFEFLTQTYRTSRPISIDETAWIEQIVTVPTTMHLPTLNFSSRLSAAVPWKSSGLSVKVSPISGGTEELYVFPIGTNWATHWLDFSHWSGQTVAIRFNLDQGAGDPYVRLNVDDISLGSWLTPQISDTFPQKIPSDASFVLQIHGANFIQSPSVRIDQTPATAVTWISAEQIEASFSMPFSAGMYALWVTNPQGVSAGRNILIGEGVFLPFVNR